MSGLTKKRALTRCSFNPILSIIRTNRLKYGTPSSDCILHQLASAQFSHSSTLHLPSSLPLRVISLRCRKNRLHAKSRPQSPKITLRVLKNILRINTAILNIIKTKQRKPSINDPETLVAIAAFTTNNSKDDQTDYDYAIEPIKHPTQGVDEAYKNTASLLDAIAKISLYKPKGGNVIATALQVNEVSGKARLIVSGNHNVSEIVGPHLKRVWGILKDISKVSSTTSGIRVKVLEGPIRSLQREIYSFSSRLFVAKFNTNSIEFRRYAAILKQSHLKPDAGPEASEWGKVLAGVVETIENNLAPLMEKLELINELDKSEWKKFCTTMDDILKGCEKLFDNRACKDLVKMANKIDKTIPKNFALYLYLQEIVSLHRDIASLAKCARSPFLQPIFAKKLTIDRVPTERSKLKIPNTEKDWERAINSVAYQQGYTILDPVLIRKASARASSHNPNSPGVVHCECLLVTYLDSLQNTSGPWAGIKPFQYIGVSKPSYQGCGSWFRAYNMVTGKSFCTRGVRPKWFFPWGIPVLKVEEQDEKVREHMAKDTAWMYCQHQEKMNAMRSRATNTDKST